LQFFRIKECTMRRFGVTVSLAVTLGVLASGAEVSAQYKMGQYTNKAGAKKDYPQWADVQQPPTAYFSYAEGTITLPNGTSLDEATISFYPSAAVPGGYAPTPTYTVKALPVPAGRQGTGIQTPPAAGGNNTSVYTVKWYGDIQNASNTFPQNTSVKVEVSAKVTANGAQSTVVYPASYSVAKKDW
jgi:hypothetical protein